MQRNEKEIFLLFLTKGDTKNIGLVLTGLSFLSCCLNLVKFQLPGL